MDLESGNAGRLDTNGTGWFIGFSDWARSTEAGAPNLRFMPKDALSRTLHMKWMQHPKGDPRGVAKPPSEGRTISILVSETGRFRLEFATDAGFSDVARHTLEQHGDFVIWGERLHHRWFVDEEATILTLRWTPCPV
jgi:hypothetical protein